MRAYYKAIYNIIKVTKSMAIDMVSTVEKIYKIKWKYQSCKNKMIRDVKEIYSYILNVPEKEKNEAKRKRKAFK